MRVRGWWSTIQLERERATGACKVCIRVYRGRGQFSLNGKQQPARTRCVCENIDHVRTSLFSCAVQGHARATLGTPFKIVRFSHDLVLSTKIIAGRRVAWILVFRLIGVHEIHVNQVFERGARARKAELVDIYAPNVE